MKLASLSFFVLLLYVHAAGDFPSVMDQPLSTFRDGPRGWIGYALFAALLLVGLLYFAALVRSDRLAEAGISLLGVAMLLIVALTPSMDGYHLLCSLLLFGLLFGYYAVLLYRAERVWLVAHLAVPILLALLVKFDSYGLWQKSFIAYFVFLATAHHFVLTLQRTEGEALSAGSPPSRRGRRIKRRKVYRLQVDEDWRRDG